MNIPSRYDESNFNSMNYFKSEEDVFKITLEQEEFMEKLYNYGSYKLEMGKEYTMRYRLPSSKDSVEVLISTKDIMDMADDILLTGEYDKTHQVNLRAIRNFIKRKMYPFDRWNEL